jgi:hypothetical protein
MKVSEALAICPDFSIQRGPDGIVKCGSLIGGETCRLPTRFRCELVMWKEKEEAKKRLPVISHSRAGTFESCNRKYMLSYVAKVQPPIRAAWKDLGSTFAVGRARIDLGQEWAVPQFIEDESRIKLEEMLRLYASAPREQVVSEVPFSFEHKGYNVRGYVDAITTDGKRLIEWKYAQSDESYTALTLSRQLGVYLKAFPAIEGVTIAVARKTRHAMGKTETADQFRARVRAEYEKAGHPTLITYKTFLRSQFNPDRETDWLIDVAEAMKFAEGRKAFPPNYRECNAMGGCDFAEFCENHVAIARIGVHGPEETCSHPIICKAIEERSP